MGDTIDPINVLKDVSRNYLSINTYSDRGHSHTIWHPNTKRARKTFLSFATYFKRPGMFRFEWKQAAEPISEYMIWSDGKNVYSKYPFNDEPQLEENLNLAIAGATGISEAIAYYIPALLMPDITGRKIINLTDLSLSGIEVFGDQECVKLCTDQNESDNFELLISLKSSLIMRINTSMSVQSGYGMSRLAENKMNDSSNDIFPPSGETVRTIQEVVYQDININADLSSDLFTPKSMLPCP